MRKFISRKPHRYRRKKTAFSNQFFRIGIALAVFAPLAFYSLFFSEFFQIEQIIITEAIFTEPGHEFIEPKYTKALKADIKSTIDEQLDNKIIFWETRSIFLSNLKKIEENILNEFLLIANIEISRKFPRTIYVVIEKRKPIAVWCQVLSEETKLLGEEKPCFLLDKQGVIFEKHIQVLPRITTMGAIQGKPKIIDRENRPIFGLGDKVIRETKLFQILDTLSVLELEIKIPIKKVEIISAHKLTFKTLETWDIYFNFQADIEWQLTKLVAVLQEKIPLEKRQDLMYIELRFEDFASFKFK
ncbi:MAG: hypothetical protein KYQ20_02130 [Candidatus Nealsonbacteria bacterium]|nr:hypothetical protein [Candidatus Nealsonbacteria bacterium]